MEIIDLPTEYERLYFVCLEDWSEEMKEAGNHKELWYNEMKGKSLRVKLALDDNGEVGGMIQYIPIEHSFAQGSDLPPVHCQPGAAPAFHPGLQSGELPAQAMLAEDNQRLVIA